MKNEKQLVLKQAYYLVNGIWTNEITFSKKDIKLLEYGIDEFGNADYILVKLLDKFELRFDKEFKENGASWSYEQLHNKAL